MSAPPEHAPSWTQPDPLLGLVLGGKYQLDALIGVGGMGAVYRATQLVVARPVAVKILREVPGVPAETLIERFRREAVATSRLHHPNTVQVIDFGESDGLLYMVLELLEGATLLRLIAAEAPFHPSRVAAIGKQIAKSLAEAHALGIIHRDLKPDNVFVCRYHGDPDFTKVMDFGIARVISAQDSMTLTGMMIGTPRYMAPEQALARQVGPAADLYALGCILFEMLTGSPPFSADSQMALALAHVNEAPPPLIVPDMPLALTEAWAQVLGALLAKDPAARPQRAADVAAWLEELELEARRGSEGGTRTSASGSELGVGAGGPRRPTSPATHPALLGRLDAGRLAHRDSGITEEASAVASRRAAWLWPAAGALMLLGGLLAYILMNT